MLTFKVAQKEKKRVSFITPFTVNSEEQNFVKTQERELSYTQKREISLPQTFSNTKNNLIPLAFRNQIILSSFYYITVCLSESYFI